MILPFTIYNTSRFGHFVLLNTNSGYAFFWSNHPIYGTHFQSILTTAKYQDLIPVELRNLDEAALDQALLRRGLQFILDDPVRYVLLSISRIPVYFMFWPSKDSGLISNISRVASFGLLWPFMLYGLYRSIAGQKQSLTDWLESPIGMLVMFVSIYSLIHLLSWSLIRYRLPVDAVLLVFAGLAVVDLTRRVIRRRKLPAHILISHSKFRMNILFIVPYVPDMVRVRPYNLIRNLTALGHQVSVATLWSNNAERNRIRTIKNGLPSGSCGTDKPMANFILLRRHIADIEAPAGSLFLAA